MSGAKRLDPQVLFPDKVELVGGLNLDSEEGVDEVFAGCAGGTKTISTKKRTTGFDAPETWVGFRLTAQGILWRPQRA